MLGLSSTREHQVAVDADHSAICKFPNTGGAYEGVSGRIVNLIQRALDLRNTTPHGVKSVQNDEDSGNRSIASGMSSTAVTLSSSENHPDQVLSHPSFMSWLGQFARPPDEPAETMSTTGTTGAELKTIISSGLPTKSKMTKEVSAGVTASLGTPVVAADVPEKSRVGEDFSQPRPSPVQNTQDADDWLSLPVFKGDIPIMLLISGLRKQASVNRNRTFSARVQLGLKTRIDELMLALTARGAKSELTRMLKLKLIMPSRVLPS